ncbi:MAG: hypothetical protein ACQEXQ_25060 [Bacillota bacterium]
MKKLYQNYKWVLVSLLPFSLLIYMVLFYTSDVPYWDQWSLPEFLHKVVNGNAILADYWSQHNEHRIFFPKLIMGILAEISNWNIYFEIAVNVLLAVIIFGIILKQYIESNQKMNVNTLLSFFIISTILFSIAQYENWSWGFQIQIYLSILGVVWGYMSLLYAEYSKWHFVISIIMGVLASYSFANGILYWFIGFFLLFKIIINKELTIKIRMILIWVLSASITIFVYFFNYNKPSGSSNFLYIFKHTDDFLAYFFAYLGAPIARFDPKLSVIIGIFAVLVYLIMSLFALQNYRKVTTHFHYWVCLGGYALFSSGVSALGRAELGYIQATSSRYTTISNLLWISIIFFGVYLSEHHFLNTKKKTRTGKKLLNICMLSLISICILFTTIESAGEWKHSFKMKEDQQVDLIAGCISENMQSIYPDKDYIKLQSQYLIKDKLSVFNTKRDIPEKIKEENNPGITGVVDGGGVTQSNCAYVTGWVVNSEINSIPKYVVGTINGEIVAYSKVNKVREDIEKSFNSSIYKFSGWSLSLPSEIINPNNPNSILNVYASNENTTSYTLIGSYSVNK